MKILALDCETAPNTALVWGTNKQFVPVKHLVDSGYTLCWSAKWLGGRGIKSASVYRDGEEKMMEEIWYLLDDADAVVHYNGKKFDIPTLNKEFLRLGWSPPSPYKQIDLYTVARRNFRLPSYKLEYVAQLLGVGSKISHKGIDLWIECMNGEEKAWLEMERYNNRDTRLLEKVYRKMLPWINNHPNYALYTDPSRPMCPKCGGTVQKRGLQPTTTMVYQRFVCTKCGAWGRSKTNVSTLDQKSNTLVQVD